MGVLIFEKIDFFCGVAMSGELFFGRRVFFCLYPPLC